MTKEKFRTLDIIIVILLVISITLSCISCVFMVKQQSSVDYLLANVDSDTTLTSIDIIEEKITGSAKNEILKQLVDDTDELLSKNIYISCPIYDDTTDSETDTYYKTYIYNTKGEVIVDDAYNENLEVIMSDSQCVVFTEEDAYAGSDSDVLRELNAAALIAQSNNGVLYEVDMQDYEDAVVRYDIDVHGYTNIKKVFNKIDSELGDSIYSYYTSLLTEDNGFEVNSEATMKFSYVYYGEEFYSAACYIYQGADEVTDTSKIYTLWAFDGYIEVYDWQLQDEWYSFDYTTLESEDDEVVQAAWDTLNDLTIELNDTVVDMLNQVQTDKYGDSESEEDAEVTTEVETDTDSEEN